MAHMRSPAGWVEPGQRPEFDEYTRRPRRLRCASSTRAAALDVRPGRRCSRARASGSATRRRTGADVRRGLPAGLLAATPCTATTSRAVKCGPGARPISVGEDVRPAAQHRAPRVPRDYTLVLESSRGLGPRGAPARTPCGSRPQGASLEHERAARTSRCGSRSGQLQLGLVDPGPATRRARSGRFPVLKRLSATAVVPREQGIEGWLWTSTGGSALTMLGDPEDAAQRGAAVHQAARRASVDRRASRPRRAPRSPPARRSARRRSRPALPRRRARHGRDRLPRRTACCAR